MRIVETSRRLDKRGNLFREFYISNAEYLLRCSNTTSSSFAVIILILEYFLTFSLLINNEQTSTSSTTPSSNSLMNTLYEHNISLHSLSEDTATNCLLVFLSINLMIECTIAILFLQYSRQPFRNRKNHFLSMIVKIYNQTILIPSIFLSAKCLSSSSSSFAIQITAVFNIFSTICIAAAIVSYHSCRDYSYLESDALAKRGSLWDMTRSSCLSFFLVSLKVLAVERTGSYQLGIAIITVFNLCDAILLMNPYYNHTINAIYICLQINMLVGVLVSSEEFPSASIVAWLCSPALSWKLGTFICELYETRITNEIEEVLSPEGAKRKNQRIRLNQRQIDFFLDFQTRRLLRKISFRRDGELLNAFRSSIRYFSFFNQPQTTTKSKQHSNQQQKFNPPSSDDSQHVGAILQSEEITTEISLKQQIQHLSQCLEGNSNANSMRQNNSKQVHLNLSEKSNNENQTKKAFRASRETNDTSLSYSMRYLFYLLEIDMNYNKLAIKLQQFVQMNGQNLSIGDEALIHLLETRMQNNLRRQQQFQSENQPSSDDQLTSSNTSQNNDQKKTNDVKQIKYPILNNVQSASIDFASAFTFQEDLNQTTSELFEALRAKVAFTCLLSADVLDLESLAKVGIVITEMCRKIPFRILELQRRCFLASRNSNGSSGNILVVSQLKEIFLECLWVDPSDYKFKLLSRFSSQTKKGRGRISWHSNRQNSMSNNENIVSEYAVQNQHQFRQFSRLHNDQNNHNSFISKKEMSVLVSLDSLRLGRILKITSESATEITQYQSDELLNKNCMMLMPTSIGMHHNELILRGIERGYFKSIYSSGITDSSSDQRELHSLLVLKRKDGFGVKINLAFQIHTMGGVRTAQEIGLIARVSVADECENEKKYILLDLSSSSSNRNSARIETVSRALFSELLRKYYTNIVQLVHADPAKFIPILPFLIKKLKSIRSEDVNGDAGDPKNYFKTIKCKSLLFFPCLDNNRSKQVREHVKETPSINEFGKIFQGIIGQGSMFNLNRNINDIYETSLSISVHYRSNQFHIMNIEFESIRLIISEQRRTQLFTQEFLPHLKQLGAISSAQEEKIIAEIFNQSLNRNYNAEGETLVAVVGTINQQEEITTKKHIENNFPTRFVKDDNDDESVLESATQLQQYQESLLGDSQSPMHSRDKENNPNNNNNNILESSLANNFNDRSSLLVQRDHPQSLRVKVLKKQQSITITAAAAAGTVTQDSMHLQQNIYDNISNSNHNNNNNNHLAAEDSTYHQLDPPTERKLLSHSQDQLTFAKQAFQGGNNQIELNSSRNLLNYISSNHLQTPNNSNNINAQLNKLSGAKQKPHEQQLLSQQATVTQDEHGSDFSYDNERTRQQKKRQKQKESLRMKEPSIHNSQQSSQRSTQSASLRSALFRGIFDGRVNFLAGILLLYISASFLVIIAVVCVTYMERRSQLTSQELAFSFSSWQDQISNHIISILRFSQVSDFLKFSRDITLTDELTAFKSTISSSIDAEYASCLEEFNRLDGYSTSELNLAESLLALTVEYHAYYDQNTYVSQSKSLYEAFMMYAYTAFTLAYKQFYQKLIVEYELIENLTAISASITQLQSQQADHSQSLVDQMQLSVELSLVLIICLSNAIAIIIFPFYFAFQKSRERILKLFSLIEPKSIHEMHEAAVNSMQILLERNSIYQSSQKQLQEQQQQQQSRNETLKYSWNYVPKKRKNIPTTSLHKFSGRLVLQILVIVATINVQPVVNEILMLNQISESTIESSIVSALYAMQTAMVSSEYALYANSQKTDAPFTTLFTSSVFEEMVSVYIEEVAEKNESLQNVVESLYSNSKYSSKDTTMGWFLMTMFTEDVCESLDSSTTVYLSEESQAKYNATLCTSLYDGVLTKGYLQAMNTFLMVIRNYGAITSNSDATKQEKSTSYHAFFQTNDPLKMENYFTIISIASEAIINCVKEQKEKLYANYNLTQLVLFLFEVGFLGVLFPLVVYPFFEDVSNEIQDTVRLIAVLQLQCIEENSYLCNFVKSRDQQTR